MGKKILNLSSDRCPECLCIETVEHFLMDCRKFDEERFEMREKLIEIDIRFEQGSFNVFQCI